MTALPETIKRPVSSATTLAAIMAGLDLTSKWLIVSFFGFETGRAVAVLPFLDFTLIWNSGISYGLFSEQGETGRYMLIGATVVIIGFIGWTVRSVETRLGVAGYGLILGGALGNLVDRLVHGAVVDFISLHAAGFYWYVFNLADVWICLGVALLLLDFWKNPAQATK
jgi:signal peptidase II